MPDRRVGFLEGLWEDAHSFQLAVGGVVVGILDHGVGFYPAGDGEFVEPAFVLEGFLRPGAGDDVQGLGEEGVVGLLVASIGVEVELYGGTGVDAPCDAEVDAALGELVHEGDVLGDAEGVPVW